MRLRVSYRRTMPAKMKFTRVAVLGSGVMGSQIAAHCAGCGLHTDLYGMPADSQPQESAAYGLKNLSQIKPDPLVWHRAPALVRALDYSRDLDELRHCDLIIEAVVENRQAKLDLYQRIAPHLSATAVLASNTSGICLTSLAEGLDVDLRTRFLGIHFFNPPRYMRLVEIITTDHTRPDIVSDLTGFLTSILGKYLIFAHDRPAFIANRIGIFALLSSIHQAARRGLQADKVDALSGARAARAKSATFRTLDLVGLDVCAKVVEGVHRDAPDDPWHEFLCLPPWIEALIDDGALGSKSGRGVYRKADGEILVFDPSKGDYRPTDKRISDSVRNTLKSSPDFAGALLSLAQSSDAEAGYLWATYCDLFHYSATHVADIAPGVREIDLAWRLGFGAQMGVFEIAQKAGWSTVVKAVSTAIDQGVTLSNTALPDWCTRIDAVYGSQGAYAPARDDYVAASTHPVYQRQLDPLTLHGLSSPYDGFECVRESNSLRCIDLGEGVAAVTFKTKMRVISHEVIVELDALLDELPASHDALVIWQGDGPFCAGANLYQLLAGVRLGSVEGRTGWWTQVKKQAFHWIQPDLPPIKHLPPVRQVVESLQRLHLKLRTSPFPVVAAVQNLALGGGCEMLMHCDRTVAHHDSYIGLVEIGVGLLPAGGGCTEMARRCALSAGDDALFPHLARTCRDLATAYVSTSARAARQHNFLDPRDTIMANPDELLYIARREALDMLEKNYTPEPPAEIRVAGEFGKANLMAELNNLSTGNWISPHDYQCAARLAHCLCGGDVPENTLLSTQTMHRLEVDGFVELLKTHQTQARMEHMLKTGKPLRN